MTPTRAKRASKAPNRFSSDNSRIEISNSTGETIIDYNDNSTSTTHNLLPVNRAIKLKPAIREPLKVKLPKLKRVSTQNTTIDNSIKTKDVDVLIRKIKLPSLSSRRLNNSSNQIDSKNNVKQSSQNKSKNNSSSSQSHKNLSQTEPNNDLSSIKDIQDSANMNVQNSTSLAKNEKSILNTSTKSIISEADKSATSSSSSDEGRQTSPRMEIVVSQTDNISSNGIRCPCGVDDDLGVMVECENCSTWQHGHCINVGSEGDAYEGYICAYCCMPRDKVRESLCQLTIGDKFHSHFQRLESLSQKHSNDSNDLKNPQEMVENCAQLNQDELAIAIHDVRRVFNSLKVKMKLLTSTNYECELRIWQNSRWSEVSSKGDNNIYFIDRCKFNLKQNIRNMINKLEKRCQLISYNIDSSAECNLTSQTQRLNELTQSLGEIVSGVANFKSQFENLPK